MRINISLIPVGLFFLNILLSGCVQAADSHPDVMLEEPALLATLPASPLETGLPLQEIEDAGGHSTMLNDQAGTVYYGYTYHRADGNRYADGKGALPGIEPLDISLRREPLWVVAAPGTEGSIWAVVFEYGSVQAFTVSGGGYKEISIKPVRLPPGMPPLLKVEGGVPMLVTAPIEDAAPLTHPVDLGEEITGFAYIAKNRDLVVSDGKETGRLPVNALPDARILVDERDRLLLLTDPTRRYDHGVLGDDLEASSITLVETEPKPRVVLKIAVLEPGVIEGIAPVWVDLNGDGEREIIVTRSDNSGGSQNIVFDESGQEIAVGPSVGRGYRWRNLLGAAPCGPGGSMELVDVLTPHLTGIVEFYSLLGHDLNVAASLEGFTSHIIGTRNLDMALAGDFDGDGRIEVLLPYQDLTELGGIRRTAERAELVWTLPLGGTLSTNLAAVSLSGGGLAVGAGREDSVLRVWSP